MRMGRLEDDCERKDQLRKTLHNQVRSYNLPAILHNFTRLPPTTTAYHLHERRQHQATSLPPVVCSTFSVRQVMELIPVSSPTHHGPHTVTEQLHTADQVPLPCQVMELKGNIRVFVRVRPPLPSEPPLLPFEFVDSGVGTTSDDCQVCIRAIGRPTT